MRFIARAVAIGFLAALATHGSASPIQFSFAITAAGDVNGVPFADTRMTIVGLADTDNVAALNGVTISVPLSQATIDIADIDAGTIEIPTRVYRSSDLGSLGLARGPVGFDLLDTVNPAYVYYGLNADLGPISDSSPQAAFQFQQVPTSFGLLSVASFRDATFTAALVPEPGGWQLAGLACLCIGLVRCCSRPLSGRGYRRALARHSSDALDGTHDGR